MRHSGNVLTFLLTVVILGGFGFLLWQNSQPTTPLRAVVPTQAEPTTEESGWQDVLRSGFGESNTAFPTNPISAQTYSPPTLAPSVEEERTPIPFAGGNAGELYTLEPRAAAVTPTLPPTSPPQSPEDGGIEVVQAAPTVITTWQPPPLLPPLSRDARGWDHYWFIRPVDSNANNRGLRNYPYGADGQLQDNPSRVHHGIDMSNPVGETVRAAGDGTIYFSSSADDPYFQNTPSYGNVVVIEHSFGWRGQPIYTLYAHLQRTLVTTGQEIATGDPIGVIGNTGSVTGSHVHWEVRVGGDRYGDTYNPVLWMIPYVGHGTIAGRIMDSRDDVLLDHDITLRNMGAAVVAATTSYIFDGTVNQVNSDPNWEENFVFGDVPAGRYQVVTVVNGQRIVEEVEVFEGMTSFVELKPSIAATAQPVETQPTPAP